MSAMATEPGSESASSGKARFPTETSDPLQQRIDQLRALTLEQRGQMIMTACRAARKIEHARMLAGLPPAIPAPWSASTLEFLKKHARAAVSKRSVAS